jgi:tetratricopeptide (TPR) repeat protein
MMTCDVGKRLNGRALAVGFALASVLATTPARAQAEDQAAARSLFEEGRRLLREGQYADACRKLEAANKLYSSAGILLNLGDCFEKVGRSASAWTEFGEAVSVAGRARREDQVKEAKHRQRALEPKLTRLSVRVANDVPGLTVKRDGTDLSSAMWGAAVPVDPGAHEIRAEAPGREPWTTSVNVATPGETMAVDVPELKSLPPVSTPVAHREPEPPASASATTPLPDSAPQASRSHVIDWALVGGGAAVGIAGGVLMILAVDKSNKAGNENTSRDSHPLAVADYDSARTLYYVGLAGIIAGGTAATAGILLLTVVSGTSPRTGLRAFPWVSSGAGGASVAGSW